MAAATSKKRRHHIAILEDNRGDLIMIQHAIREAGLDCEITTFTDGVAALTYVNEPESPIPDVLILDCNVPGVEGPAVLNSVRSNTRWSEVSVFMFTGSHDPGDIDRAKKLGADHYLIKPMDLAGFAKIGYAVKERLEKEQLQAPWNG